MCCSLALLLVTAWRYLLSNKKIMASRGPLKPAPLFFSFLLIPVIMKLLVLRQLHPSYFFCMLCDGATIYQSQRKEYDTQHAVNIITFANASANSYITVWRKTVPLWEQSVILKCLGSARVTLVAVFWQTFEDVLGARVTCVRESVL